MYGTYSDTRGWCNHRLLLRIKHLNVFITVLVVHTWMAWQENAKSHSAQFGCDNERLQISTCMHAEMKASSSSQPKVVLRVVSSDMREQNVFDFSMEPHWGHGWIYGFVLISLHELHWKFRGLYALNTQSHTGSIKTCLSPVQASGDLISPKQLERWL